MIHGQNLHQSKQAPKPVKVYGKKAFPPNSATGPDLAILSVKAPAQRTIPASHRRRYRDLSNLKAEQVENLFEADAHAKKIGRPLNTFISIAWLLTDTSSIDGDAFRRACKAMARWLWKRRVCPTFVYVHENPQSDFGDDRPNTHLLLHVPPKISQDEFSEALTRCFRAIDGGVKIEPRRYRWHVGADRLAYMIKGAPQPICFKHGAKRKRGGQGIVTIKRSGSSQNIGAAARRSAMAERITA